jgi:outer membrane immunogenic protein
VTVDGSATVTGFACPVPIGFQICPLGAFSNGVTRGGWTVGGGVEGAVGDNWSLKVEYLYVDLGTVTTTFATLPGCFGIPGGCIGIAAGSGTISSRITDNIVRVGLNYRFGGPVVARY